MRDREDAAGASLARPVQTGALFATVVVSVILLAVVSARSKRLAELQRGVAENRKEIGRLAERPDDPDVAAGLDELGRSVRKLRATTERLDGEVTALGRESGFQELSDSMGSLTKIVGGLSDELAEVKRLAEKPVEAPRPAATEGVSPDDVAALSERVASMERRLEDSEKERESPADATAGGNVRIDEKALRAMVRKTIEEEIENAMRDMRDRFRPGRRR
jgi:hypothetical protein